MGNNSTKEAKSRDRPQNLRNIASGEGVPRDQPSPQSPIERIAPGVYSSRIGRGSRPDLSFLHLGGGGSDRDAAPVEPRRETKQEREARKVEKERIAREKERERSLKEEGVDGGYLVTLGTYTGPEDYSKQVVRQLQVCYAVDVVNRHTHS